MISKKDYEAIASIFAKYDREIEEGVIVTSDELWNKMRFAFASYFEDGNDRFNAEKFMQACRG